MIHIKRRRDFVKRLPMILLLLEPHILFATFNWVCTTETVSASGVCLIFFILILLFNMIYAFLLPRLGFEGQKILFWNMLLKLCNIPIFLVIFLVGMLTHFLILPLIPFFILFDYFLLLSSTMFGISGLLSCYKSQQLSYRTLVVNIVAQFFFCVDVISAVYCYIKVCRAKKQQAAEESVRIPGTDPAIYMDPDAIEIFINSDQDQYAMLYHKHGAFTFSIYEKRSDEFNGVTSYYWCDNRKTASFFDTKENAIREILSLIETGKDENEIDVSETDKQDESLLDFF